MSVEKYVFPIFREIPEGIIFKGNGFFVGNLFFTAEHVIMPEEGTFYGETFIIIGDRKVLLSNKLDLNYKSLIYKENRLAEGHEDKDRTDFCVFDLADVGINSPLRLATSLPARGQHLQCDFYHHIKGSCIPSKKVKIEKPKLLYFWETKAIVESDDKCFVGNFFAARMNPSHPEVGNSSGSPLFDENNIVYGILHDGEGDFCGFYAAAHANQLLRQAQIFVDQVT